MTDDRPIPTGDPAVEPSVVVLAAAVPPYTLLRREIFCIGGKRSLGPGNAGRGLACCIKA